MKEYHYRLSSESLADNQLKDFLSQEDREKVTVFFDEDDSQIEKLQEMFGENFKFGFGVSSSDIKAMGEDNGSPIAVSKSSLAELSQSFDSGFSQMPYDIDSKSYYLDQCKEIYNDGDCLSFYLDDQLVGLNLLGKIAIKDIEKTLIAWTWISKSIDLAARQKLKHLIFEQMTREGTGLVASIHQKNKSSIKFLSSMNFRRICIIC